MPILDLMNLEKTKISRDLKDKYILLYGPAKCGKTSFAAMCPNNLIFCFEKGLNFIDGVYGVDIAKWSEFKALLKQLEKPELKEKFHTVTIDTVSIAWGLCEKYICESKGVKTISEIPWGQGYALLKDEFANALRQISMLGYGMILITHSKTRLEKVDDEHTIEIVSPNIPERAQDIVNALVDIIGYIDIRFKKEGKEGEAVRTLITRQSPTVVAGSRLKYLAPRIPFGYDELVIAMNNAIERQHQEDGAEVIDKKEVQDIITTRPFEEAIAEARELWQKLVGKGETPEEKENYNKISALIEDTFKKPMKLSEIDSSQQDLFEIVINAMNAM